MYIIYGSDLRVIFHEPILLLLLYRAGRLFHRFFWSLLIDRRSVGLIVRGRTKTCFRMTERGESKKGINTLYKAQ